MASVSGAYVVLNEKPIEYPEHDVALVRGIHVLAECVEAGGDSGRETMRLQQSELEGWTRLPIEAHERLREKGSQRRPSFSSITVSVE